jgi:chemotaxis protein MotB
VKQTDQGVVITIADSLMFESGRAEIRAEALPILENLAEIMAANASVKEVRVQGHTDNVPINSALFPSNWELSAVRAAMVTRAMTELYGMQPEKISAVGFGEFRPVADNLTPENREKNRRVELLILTNETDEDL